MVVEIPLRLIAADPKCGSFLIGAIAGHGYGPEGRRANLIAVYHRSQLDL
jgi:hypothetical protein